LFSKAIGIWRVNSSPKGLKIAVRDGSPTTSQEIWQRPSSNSCSKMRPNSPAKTGGDQQYHAFVNRQCRFMNAFEHVLGRYAKQETDDHILTACLTAWATNMGLGRMGEISDISFHTLASASDNFIRPETLHEANDRISNAIAKLPIFRHYDIGDALHSSSDGQKFETSIHTLNARHSPKYLRPLRKESFPTLSSSPTMFLSMPTSSAERARKPLRVRHPVQQHH
jgi:Tn3 transposase DDE domain